MLVKMIGIPYLYLAMNSPWKINFASSGSFLLNVLLFSSSCCFLKFLLLHNWFWGAWRKNTESTRLLEKSTKSTKNYYVKCIWLVELYKNSFRRTLLLVSFFCKNWWNWLKKEYKQFLFAPNIPSLLTFSLNNNIHWLFQTYF